MVLRNSRTGTGVILIEEVSTVAAEVANHVQFNSLVTVDWDEPEPQSECE